MLVDYSKAFNQINPNILLRQLIDLDIPPLLLHWIMDLLLDRSQRVHVGGAMSSPLDIWATVPQGTNFGMILIILMINDKIQDSRFKLLY